MGRRWPKVGVWPKGAWAKRRWAHRTKLCVLIGRLRWPVPRIVARLVQPARSGRGNTSRHLRKDRSMGPARTHGQPQGCREQGEHARHGWLMDGAADDGTRWTTGDCIPTFFSRFSTVSRFLLAKNGLLSGGGGILSQPCTSAWLTVSPRCRDSPIPVRMSGTTTLSFWRRPEGGADAPMYAVATVRNVPPHPQAGATRRPRGRGRFLPSCLHIRSRARRAPFASVRGHSVHHAARRQEKHQRCRISDREAVCRIRCRRSQQA